MAEMNKWELLEDPALRRRLGKTGEELAELQGVVSRIMIQGLDAIDTGTGKINRQRLHEETADVLAQLTVNLSALDMDMDFIQARKFRKEKEMEEWESLYR